MHTLTIELLRFGGSAGILDPLNNYLVLAGDVMPPGARAINLSHRQLLRYLFELRYPTNDSPEILKKALSVLSREADYLLRIPDDLETPLQIDLVTSAAELWAFPFEALLLQDRFKEAQGPVIITRRIRREDEAHEFDWPIQPRVLFAFASPSYVAAKPVPSEQHKEALRNALKPWIEPLEIPDFPSAVPNETSVLTVLKEASLSSLGEELRKAESDGQPYSHVHILAHGVVIPGEFGAHENQYGLGLNSDNDKAISPERLAHELAPRNGHPVCVTLTVCDGGNQSNSIVPGSLALSLHESGIPVVIASQFPLTMHGSSILTEEFYTSMLNGEDVRLSINKSRKALRNASDNGALHDWMSLVAYVQLPKGYREYLHNYVLKRQFASLRTVQKWSDHIIANKITDEASLKRVEHTLDSRIENLLQAYRDKSKANTKGVFEELTGLLGSAYTRKAELQFFMSSALGVDSYKEASRDSLSLALKYYREGHDHNLSAHWNGIQYMSLQCVLNGELEDPAYWHATRLAADISLQESNEVWAWGTLAELYLLAPYAGLSPMPEKSLESLNSLIQTCKDLKYNFPVESTRRHFQRYSSWWTHENGYFGDAESDLAGDVVQLIEVLDNN